MRQSEREEEDENVTAGVTAKEKDDNKNKPIEVFNARNSS